MNEDLQDKYRDKNGELKPASVPLAADSAHLLTDYLDTITVQLIRHGVVEAYRITREFEEILVRELEKQGSTSKLTYDVTAKVLENFGSPAEVAKEYIDEHQPKQERILAPADPIRSKTPETSDSSPSLSFLDFDEKPFPMSLLPTLLNLVVALAIAVHLVGMVIYIFGYGIYSVFYDMTADAGIVYIMFSYVFIEVLTGILNTTFVPKRVYNILRETIRFEISATFLIYVAKLMKSIGSVRGTIEPDPFIFFPFVFIMGIGLIKDRLGICYSSAHTKPPARFLIRSYLVLILAYVLGYIAFFLHDDTPVDGLSLTLMMVSLPLVIVGLLLDANRQYPYSIKKLGYSLMYISLIPLIYFRYDYYSFDDYGWGYELVGRKYETGYLSMIYPILAILFLIAILVVFRPEIREQLSEYRLSVERSLDDYKNS